MSNSKNAPPPPPMPTIRPALLKVDDARNALNRAADAWNKGQLLDALDSAERFIQQARQSLENKNA